MSKNNGFARLKDFHHIIVTVCKQITQQLGTIYVNCLNKPEQIFFMCLVGQKVFMKIPFGKINNGTDHYTKNEELINKDKQIDQLN